MTDSIDLGEIEVTDRGLEVIEFEDVSGRPCSLGTSSLATDHAVWLGLGEGRLRMHLTLTQVCDLVAALQNWTATGSFKEIR